MQNEWTELDDWKQITSNLVVAEGQVFAFDALLGRMRVRMAGALTLVLVCALLLTFALAILLVNFFRHQEGVFFELLPAISIMFSFAVTCAYIQWQKLRELHAEAQLARTAQEHARRRVLDRNLGVNKS